MAKLILNDVADLLDTSTAQTTINNNWAAIETAVEKTLSRDGTSPNTMSASLDMNSNRILNLSEAVSGSEPVRKTEFDEAVLGSASTISSIGFAANKGAVDQTSIADSTFTKITYTNERFDRGGYYNNTLSRWVPPAGMVSITASYLVTGTWSQGAAIVICIFKNGSNFLQGNNFSVLAGGHAVDLTISDYASGTDYYEAYCYVDVSSGTATISGNITNTHFTGVWIGNN